MSDGEEKTPHHLTAWLYLQEGGDFDGVAEGLASVESLVDDFDEEIHIGLFGVEFVDQVESGLHGSTCGEEIIVEEDDVILVDGVLMDFDGVDAIFLGVGFLNRFGGEFSRFAAEHDACTEFHRKCRSHDESPAFYADDFCDAFVFVEFIEFVEHDLDAFRVLEECCHVSEVDSLDGEVRDASQVVQ